MRRMQGTRRMFTMITGNLLEDYRKLSQFSIQGNAREDSGEFYRRFLGMFKKIPADVQEDSGECYQRFQIMLSMILGNDQENSRECVERFQGMFRKIAGNAFNFKLLKVNFEDVIYLFCI